MKKTLHGRRHLRARRSVQIGRERRWLRKVKRLMNIEFPQFVQMIRAAQQAAESMQLITNGATRMGEYFQRKVIIPNSQIGDSHGLSEVKPTA